MAADRRWNERRFQLEQSATQNNGKKTVFIEHMSPGTAVPPHFHTRFSETFDLISGNIAAYSSEQSHSTEPDIEALEAGVQQLEIGNPVTIQPKIYHKYLSGEGNTTLRVILTPGDADFERLLMIMNGLANDGKLADMTDSMVLMAVIMDLSDAHLIGPAKQMLEGVRQTKTQEIAELKADLLNRYDTEESLKLLLATEE